MHTKSTAVFVFETNLQTPENIEVLRPLLDGHPQVDRWNVDLHDVDNVLRIVPHPSLKAEDIVVLLNKAGFSCRELPD